MWFTSWSMYRDEGFFDDAGSCGQYRIVCRYTDPDRAWTDNLVKFCTWSSNDASPGMLQLCQWWFQEMLPNGDELFVHDKEG